MTENSLDALLTKLISLRFSHEDLPPFFLIGISAFSQIDPRGFVIFDVNISPPSSKKDGDNRSGPIAFYFFRRLILLITSIFERGPVLTCTVSLADITGRAIMAVG